MNRIRAIVVTGVVCLWVAVIGTAHSAQEAAPAAVAITRFSGASAATLPPPWRVVGLPGNKVPLAQIDIATLGPDRVLRLRTDQSYGTASHALPPKTAAGTLAWRWRLDQPIEAADLRKKEGDDAALKVCAMFDMPLDRLGFVERNILRLARSASGEYLPAATLCYVWDQKLPVGTELPNAYSNRVRFVVVDSATNPSGPASSLQQWVSHTRNLRTDFLKAFGAESDTVPPLLAIVVGADSDNTGQSSLGYVGDLVFTPLPAQP